MNIAYFAPKWVYDPKRTRALRPVDGDSLWVRCGLALSASLDVELRIRGINAPDRGEPGREEAKAALWDLVASKDLYVLTFKEGRSFIRYLADIWIDPDEGGELQSVADLLVQRGYAVYWPPPVEVL